MFELELQVKRHSSKIAWCFQNITICNLSGLFMKHANMTIKSFRQKVALTRNENNNMRARK